VARNRRFDTWTAGILLAWATLVVAWSYAARDWLPVAPRHFWPAATEKRAPPLARYDSGWYLAIAEVGYGAAPARGEPSAHAFFPLYPMLIRGVARVLHVDGLIVGPIFSLACLFAAGFLFAAEGRRRLGDRPGSQALLFLLLYPTAFFFAAMYSESLFLLLALLAFRSARAGRIPPAVLFGFLTGTSRVTALALALPLAIEAFGARKESGPRARRASPLASALLVGAAPVAGVLLWVFGAGWLAGESGLFFRIQQAWQRGASPLEGIRRFAEGLPARIARGDARDHPAFLIDYAHLALFATIGFYQARRRRFADAAWTAGALLLPVASGVAASLPRYLLVVYPAFYALAEFFRGRPRLRLAWWIGSGLLLLAGEAAFVHWRWVA
jgi:mannosyltransferase PIG-V